MRVRVIIRVRMRVRMCVCVCEEPSLCFLARILGEGVTEDGGERESEGTMRLRLRVLR